MAAEGEEVLFPMPALARPGLTCDCRPCHSRNTPTYIPESASSRSAFSAPLSNLVRPGTTAIKVEVTAPPES